MKRFLSVFLSLSLCFSLLFSVGTVSFAADTKKDFSLLFIGNSYAEDSAVQHLYPILCDLGYDDIKIGVLRIGYCSLETHKDNLDNAKNEYTYFYISSENNGEVKKTENVSIQTAIKSYDWEYVSLQQNARNSGLAETYDDAAYIYEKVLGFVPDAKLVWNMTWSYGVYSGSEDFEIYSYDQMNMYNLIVEAVQTKILPMNNITVIPNGTAIQNIRTVYPDSVITRDMHHMSYEFGRFLAAMTVAKAITGRNISVVKYCPAELTEKQKVDIITAVNMADADPYAVTDIKGLTDAKASAFSSINDLISTGFATEAMLKTASEAKALITAETSFEKVNELSASYYNTLYLLEREAEGYCIKQISGICNTYNDNKDVPVIGIILRLFHKIVHFFWGR